ncbi:MAG: hypothetical protein M3R27_06630 [Bacteroidota bacterium]|nr:hypothetical protein [Bacteroidota bacterium]
MSGKYRLLLSIILSLFIALFLILSFYSRLATDDYYFIWEVRTQGFLASVYSHYMGWCGRFAAIFLMNVVYKMDTQQTWYFLFPITCFVLLISGVKYALGILSSKLTLHLSGKWMLSLTFTALFFFLSVDVGESWFWYCSLSSYLLSMIGIIWGMAFLFSTGKLTLFLACLCFVYIGGSSEVYSVMYGLLLLIWMIYKWKKQPDFKSFFSRVDIQRFLIVSLVFGLSFLVFLIAPGNYLRDGQFPAHDVWKSFYISAKSIVKFFAIYLPFKTLYILAFVPVFIVAGRASALSFKGVSFMRFFKIASIIFSALTMIFFYMVAFVMVETGPPRMWFLLSFLLAVYFSLIGFYAGYSNFINEQKTRILSLSGIVLSALVLTYTLFTQIPIANKYAQANDQRIMNLLELNQQEENTGKVIALPPLPSPGMLYSAEIKADTNHFTNKELRLGYSLKFYPICHK